MNSDTLEIKVNKAWKTLIAESPIYLLMFNRELGKCKDFLFQDIIQQLGILTYELSKS